ncbi:hypothetical protein N9D31_04130, partial [Oligoflexaceae bacterium]|nr:hypothetical protein [Oligoflexaceae bacterium]
MTVTLVQETEEPVFWQDCDQSETAPSVELQAGDKFVTVWFESGDEITSLYLGERYVGNFAITAPIAEAGRTFGGDGINCDVSCEGST